MADHPRSPLRELGLRDAVALGVGGTIGGGIFVLVGVMALESGPSAIFAFPVAFIVGLPVALPYAELSCRRSRAGGAYAFTAEQLGHRIAFPVGWAFAWAWAWSSGYVFLGFGGYLHSVTGIPRKAGALALIALSTRINLLGPKNTGRAQSAVLGLAIAGLGAFAVFSAPDVRGDNFHPFVPEGLHGVVVASLLSAVALGGFDVVASAGEEIRNPSRNLPLGIFITFRIAFLLYMGVALVAIGVLGWERLGTSSAPLSDAAKSAFGPTGGMAMTVIALLTTAATGNAVLVAVSRVLFAMGRERQLPAWLDNIDERRNVPRNAVLFTDVMLAGITLTGSAAAVAKVGSLLYFAHFVPPLIALVILVRRGGDARPAFVTPLPWVVFPAAFL